jgi:hypothetical protein
MGDMVNCMANLKPQNRVPSRWATLKGFTPMFLFIIIAVFVEYLVVAYAMSLGVEDASLLRSNFQFPGTSWTVTMAVSPLFHLVPLAVIVALVASWVYLERHVRIRPQETWKGKAGQLPKHGRKAESKLTQFLGRIGSTLSKVKGFDYVWKKAHPARAKIRGAVMVFVIFALFVIVTSLLAFQQAIYRGALNLYQTNPSLLGFVRGTNAALAPVGNAVSAMNGAAPGFRDFAVGVGNVFKPLVQLDGPGKYLVFQNAAAWLSALVVLFYVAFGHRGYRYKRK